jgi:23S rRNA pseudouridine2604 synthase
MQNPEFPMRINKFIAFKKKGTRRDGDRMVKNKKVLINGRIAVLGDKVNEGDIVEILSTEKPKSYHYFAYHKPIGEVTGEQAMSDKTLFPLGRLDKDSSGLMLLTDDGRVTDRLLNPEYGHEKEYIVKVTDSLRNNFKEKMESGVDIEGEMTRPCKISIIDDFTFKITLTEGKKHQIRRMCVALHNQVKSLKRIRIMNIELGGMPSGSKRAIESKELSLFLKNLGL